VLSGLLRYMDSDYPFGFSKHFLAKNQSSTNGGCCERVSSSYSTSGSRGVSLVTNPVISHIRGKDREVLTTSGTYPWSFVTQHWALVLSVLLRYMDSDYPFGFSKLFLATNQSSTSYFGQNFSQLTINGLMYFQKPLRTHHIRTKLYSVPLYPLCCLWIVVLFFFILCTPYVASFS
jgi:hypothetical protein